MLTITNEDCMDMMARYPDRHFDLAVVDPPSGWEASRICPAAAFPQSAASSTDTIL